MHLPRNVSYILSIYGILESIYDLSVAIHEAAHTCIALHLVAPLDCIELNAQHGKSSYSRARTVWRTGNLMHNQIIAVMAAGPVAERRCVEKTGMPYEFLDSVEREESIIFDKYLDNQLTIERSLYDMHWAEAKSRADVLLDIKDVDTCVGRIKKMILYALQTERTKIQASEIVPTK